MTFDTNQLFAEIFLENLIFGQNFAPRKFQFEVLVYFSSDFNRLCVCFWALALF